MKIRTLTDVVDWRLCVGCGACAYICPSDNVSLRDIEEDGIRPKLDGGQCGECHECLDVCPGVQADFGLHVERGEPVSSFEREWGPVLEVWEGCATDPEIRFQGASGGALTALAAYCIEQVGMAGALHIGQHPDYPLRNSTRLSRSRSELLSAVGSRYAPASVCDRLDLVEEAPVSCVVIGKPSEIAALRNAQRLRPRLNDRVGVAMSFFCAETPSTRGTLSLLRKMKVEPSSVADLRYRGQGWPGNFAPTCKGEAAPAAIMSYRESWAFLQAFRPWPAHTWPDGGGELADISCGDPWYEEPDGKNPGFSLVVVRTERGRQIVRAAMAAGYLHLEPAAPWKLEKSQFGLLRKKGSVWGRRLAMRCMGIPTTRFRGLHLFHCWCLLTNAEKLRSILGNPVAARPASIFPQAGESQVYAGVLWEGPPSVA